MSVLFKDLAITTIAADITDSATSITVDTGDGALFPSPSGGDWFPFVVSKRTKSGVVYENMRCTARSSDVLTVSRGQDGTIAVAFTAGSGAECRVTEGVFKYRRADSALSWLRP